MRLCVAEKNRSRGINGRVYPWDEEYLAGHTNINETRDDSGPHNLDRTCAVGIYPQGASPEGLLDLSGNVWEFGRAAPMSRHSIHG